MQLSCIYLPDIDTEHLGHTEIAIADACQQEDKAKTDYQSQQF